MLSGSTTKDSIRRAQFSVICQTKLHLHLIFEKGTFCLNKQISALNQGAYWLKKNDLFVSRSCQRSKATSRLAEFGREFDMRLSWTETVRERHVSRSEKNPTRLVKHPDSLWETSVVCAGVCGQGFSRHHCGEDMWRLDRVFFSPSISGLCPFFVPIKQLR